MIEIDELVDKIIDKAKELNDKELAELINSILTENDEEEKQIRFGAIYIYFFSNNSKITELVPNIRNELVSKTRFRSFFYEKLSKLSNQRLEKIWFELS